MTDADRHVAELLNRKLNADQRAGLDALLLPHPNTNLSVLACRPKQSTGRRRSARAEQNQAIEIVDPETGENRPASDPCVADRRRIYADVIWLL